MEQKAIFLINDRTTSIEENYDNSSINMQILKDSLENSVNLMNCISLNVTINN
jgi:hypothetical protein